MGVHVRKMRSLVYHYDCETEWRIKAGCRTKKINGRSFGTLILNKKFIADALNWTWKKQK
jgi:hypothetical protein